MAKRARFHTLVPRDIARALRWYEGKSLALSERFRDAVKDRIAAIKSRPHSFGRMAGERRVAKVNEFPYLILFEIKSDFVLILGVFHSASDPAKWTSRSL